MIAECFLETIHQSSAHEFEELLQRRQAEDKALRRHVQCRPYR